jgi:hypothetical protein
MNMGFPTIPNVTPSISINRADVINLLLASVAFEELGLAHIINAEGEKIQAVIGTLPGGQIPPATTVDQLLAANDLVNKTMKTVLKTQMLLQFKMEDILAIPEIPTPPPTIFENIATVSGFFEGAVVSDSDNAFYYTQG